MDDAKDWYERLTPKEREALETYARVRHCTGVARAFGISDSAVEKRLRRVRDKLDVSTTGEATCLLAERNARLAAEEKLASVSERAVSPVPAELRREEANQSRMPAARSAFTDQDGAQRDCANRCAARYSIDELVLRLQALSVPSLDHVGGDTADRRRLELVDQTCMIAWQAMWGPTEDYVKDRMCDIAADIRTAYDWALTADPNAAVRIVGNGHRLFSRILDPSLSDWPQMIDSALNRPEADRESPHYGRALCGRAFALCEDAEVEVGFRSAKLAADLFGRIGGADWDRANAIRHMGLCSVGRDQRKGLELYETALSMFRELKCPRGQAQTMLSLAQAGIAKGFADAAERVQWAVQAVRSWRSLRNQSCYAAALLEMEKNEKYVPLGQDRGLRLEVRAELRQAAEERHKAVDIRRAIELRAQCIEIGVKVADPEGVAEDIEHLFCRSILGFEMDEGSANVLACYYQEVCRRIGREAREGVAPYVRPDLSPASSGPRSPQEVVDAANRLTIRRVL